MALSQATDTEIRVENLTLAFNEFVVLRNLSFSVPRGSIFFIVGGSGSGKSTLLRHLVGLHEPVAGKIFYRDEPFLRQTPEARERTLRRMGVLYQGGALFGSMSLFDNIALPLMEFTRLNPSEIRQLSEVKLAMVGLRGFETFQPAALSGGMQKRAGLARAMVLDPEILFLDEPSAGLDPITSRRLDDLILDLRDSLRATVVIVSHELASIFGIGDHCIFLDSETRTIGATGPPRELRDHPPSSRVAEFFSRGERHLDGAGGSDHGP